MRLLTVLPGRSGLVFTGDKGGPFDYSKPFITAVEAAGLVNFHFHDLRHSAATMLASRRDRTPPSR